MVTKSIDAYTRHWTPMGYYTKERFLVSARMFYYKRAFNNRNTLATQRDIDFYNNVFLTFLLVFIFSK